jgi:amidase
VSTHIHIPRRYSLTYSSRSEPVLRIRSGDAVETTSVDCEGNDETGRCVGPRPNAVTGPFYIEEAQPGDVLAVVLERVCLTGTAGLSFSELGENATLPREFVRSLQGAKTYRWSYDLEAMIGSTDLTPRLRRLRLPLRPFPGCIGVAPAKGEALSTLTAGPHGGNIDYNRLGQGVTVYLPISVAGAYFYFGDGHAAQGDGESNGGAVEATLAVRFRVEVLARREIPSLRAESADYIMAVGVGEPLDRAYRLATANMIDWLTRDYCLDLPEVYALIGLAGRFDIASVVNERGSPVACRIAKALLRQVTSGD